MAGRNIVDLESWSVENGARVPPLPLLETSFRTNFGNVFQLLFLAIVPKFELW
jgi:hypothetical protein